MYPKVRLNNSTKKKNFCVKVRLKGSTDKETENQKEAEWP